jgi:hypothetical protein
MALVIGTARPSPESPSLLVGPLVAYNFAHEKPSAGPGSRRASGPFDSEGSVTRRRDRRLLCLLAEDGG